ncbi:MAG TPA: hypothetical protein VMQ67_00645, partial [Candidatus Saccharimonadales bacterium]|nr:hypothetical protein [Candidatus Saccharimonadales bacterium]
YQWAFSSPNVYYSTLASWEAVVGETGSSYIASTLTLVNTNTGVLPSGSPAIGTGNIAAITDGVTGWPTGGPIDVGAFAFQNTSLTLIGSPSGVTLTGGAGGITLTH